MIPVIDFIHTNRDRYIKELTDYLAIPSISALPEKWQWVLALNPMTAVISGFQWGVIGTPTPDLGKLAISVATTVVFFVGGLWYFRRTEPRFADTV